MKATVPAPTKLSEAIHMALKDQLAVEKNHRIEIAMTAWHRGQLGRAKCAVCFAGAVMHQKFKLLLSSTMKPDLFPADWCEVFMALESVRNGRIKDALLYMWPTAKSRAEWVAKTIKVASPMPQYDNARYAFRKEMRSIAKQLERKGL